MEKLDSMVADSIAQRLSQPKRLEQLLSHLLDRCTERAERSKLLIAKLRERATEADAKLMQGAIERAGPTITPQAEPIRRWGRPNVTEPCRGTGC